MSLSAQDAKKLDIDLVEEYNFSIEELMERAGKCVADAAHHYLTSMGAKANCSVLVACGPGNNGADGIVACRYLTAMGYKVHCWISVPPKAGSLNEKMHAKLKSEYPNTNFLSPFSYKEIPNEVKESTILIDALFGFSQSGQIRPPFPSTFLMCKLMFDSNPEMKVFAVDTPSGYPVNGGDLSVEELQLFAIKALGIIPDAIISLTAPKFITMKMVNLKPCKMVDTGIVDPDDPSDDGIHAVPHSITHYIGLKDIPTGIKEKYHLKSDSEFSWINDSEIAVITDVKFKHWK